MRACEDAKTQAGSGAAHRALDASCTTDDIMTDYNRHRSDIQAVCLGGGTAIKPMARLPQHDRFGSLDHRLSRLASIP